MKGGGENDYIYKADYDRYIEAHGEDEVIGLINETDDYSLLPVHNFKKKRDYEQGDNKYVFELTDEQASSYDSLAEEYANAEYQLVMNSQSWSTMDKTQKAQALKKAKEKATGKVSEFIKWDYIYKDIIKEFDGMYGEDNPVRRAYEYSHDATVYPDWILDDKVTFSYKKKDYEYVLSKVPGSYDGNESEYDYWQRKFSENMLRNYSDNDFLALRLGTGVKKSGIPIQISEKHFSLIDDPLTDGPGNIVKQYENYESAPIVTSWKEDKIIGIFGSSSKIETVVNNLLVNTLFLHAPQNVKTVFLFEDTATASKYDCYFDTPHIWSSTKDIRYLSVDKEHTKKILSVIYNTVLVSGVQ